MNRKNYLKITEKSITLRKKLSLIQCYSLEPRSGNQHFPVDPSTSRKLQTQDRYAKLTRVAGGGRRGGWMGPSRPDAERITKPKIDQNESLFYVNGASFKSVKTLRECGVTQAEIHPLQRPTQDRPHPPPSPLHPSDPLSATPRPNN